MPTPCLTVLRSVGCALSTSFRLVRKRRLSHLQASRKEEKFLQISDEIRSAVRFGRPVVALETTIYTHGFPYPDNAALAIRLESIVRENGAVPATIGVVNGVARVGFKSDELDELAASAGRPETRKLSRRDLGYICGLGLKHQKLNGGTTIAGTMILAHLAGIKIFATGGLGGVHRGAENSMDISADLIELGRTPVSVISSGCKSFLDIPRTLEFLETQGVFVGTFADGREGKVDFPAFWTRDSGILSPAAVEDEKQAAAIIYAQRSLAIESGMLFTNPIPAAHSLEKTYMDGIITRALQDAKESGSSGSDNTPYILKRIRELTGGSTVTANSILVEENVLLGTKIAIELAKLERQYQLPEYSDGGISADTNIENPSPPDKLKAPVMAPEIVHHLTPHNCAKIMVAGSLAIDLACDYISPEGPTIRHIPKQSTSNPAVIKQSLGGVGQNVAMTIHYLGTPVRLFSLVGNDIAGSTAIRQVAEKGLQTAGIMQIPGRSTAQYVAINDSRKDLVMAMADMTIMEQSQICGRNQDQKGLNNQWRVHLASCKPKWAVVDANWDTKSLWMLIEASKREHTKVAFEPVSAAKSRRLCQTKSTEMLSCTIDLATPNAVELNSMYAAAKEANWFDSEWEKTVDAMGMIEASLDGTQVVHQAVALLPCIPTILTKIGAKGVLMTRLLLRSDDLLKSPDAAQYIFGRTDIADAAYGGVYVRLFPAVEKVPESEVISVNGVGDTFLGVIMAGLAKENPKKLEDLIDVAQRGSVMTLRSEESVSPEVSTLQSEL